MTSIATEVEQPDTIHGNGRGWEEPHRSYLVADCGHVQTTVALFDVVEGAYRFVASGSALSTAGAPWYDIARALQDAIGQVAQITGRRLLDDQGTLIRPLRPDGSGVDNFGVVVSAAQPIKTLVAGMLEDVSIASVRRAIETIYSDQVDQFSLSDTRSRQTQVKAILGNKPDLILLAGGTDGGADLRLMEMVETIALGVGMIEDVQRPVVAFAGNKKLRPRITETLGGLTSLHIVDNVRPSLETEQLRPTIDLVSEIFSATKVSAVQGLDSVLGWSNLVPLPTAHAFAGIIEYFAEIYRGPVLGVDVGSNSLTLVAAEPNNMRLMVRSDLGLGEPLRYLVQEDSELSSILRWTASDANLERLRSYLFNKTLNPQAAPMSDEDLSLEQATLRIVIRRALERAKESWEWAADREFPLTRLLLLRGSVFTSSSRPARLILAALDALQPSGIFPVAIDRYGVLPALGMIAPHNPRLVVDSLEGGLMEDLGWVIAPSGRLKPGRTILTVHMESEEVGTLDLEVESGRLEVLPLRHGHHAKLTLRPARRIDVGRGPGRTRKVRIRGGTAGLIVDARGRPFELPAADPERKAMLQRWQADAGG